MNSDLRAVFSTLRLQMKLTFARATFRFVVLVQPMVYATISYMMFRQSLADSFMAYVVLGTGLATLWSTIVFSSAGDIERERFYGNLELLSISPVPLKTTIYGKILGNTLLGLFSMAYSFLFVRVVYRVPLVIPSAGRFALALALSVLCLVSLSAVMAGCFTLSRNSRGLMNGLEFPVYILSGVMFPITMLPSWAHPLSYAVGMTWVVGGLRSSLGVEALPVSFGWNMAILGLFSAAQFVLAAWLFGRVEWRTRVNATLGVH